MGTRRENVEREKGNKKEEFMIGVIFTTWLAISRKWGRYANGPDSCGFVRIR